MSIPEHPKIYHIIHVDRLPSVIEDGCLWSDAEMVNHADTGTVIARNWSGGGIAASVKDGKQAEFLVEHHFPWNLVDRVGTRSRDIAQRASDSLTGQAHRPPVEIKKDWYYGG